MFIKNTQNHPKDPKSPAANQALSILEDYKIKAYYHQEFVDLLNDVGKPIVVDIFVPEHGLILFNEGLTYKGSVLSTKEQFDYVNMWAKTHLTPVFYWDNDSDAGNLKNRLNGWLLETGSLYTSSELAKYVWQDFVDSKPLPEIKDPYSALDDLMD